MSTSDGSGNSGGGSGQRPSLCGPSLTFLLTRVRVFGGRQKNGKQISAESSLPDRGAEGRGRSNAGFKKLIQTDERILACVGDIPLIIRSYFN